MARLWIAQALLRVKHQSDAIVKKQRVVDDFLVPGNELRFPHILLLLVVQREHKGAVMILPQGAKVKLSGQLHDHIGRIVVVPAVAWGKLRGLGRVSLVASRRTAFHPLHDGADLGFGKSDVVPHRHSRRQMPGRHGAVGDKGLDVIRPGVRVVVSRQFEWGDLALAVALQAPGVDDRLDIAVESDRARRGRGFPRPF
ncbi:MAG: hypothetical protein FJ261_08995, partial [Planctomycetes bacterium]|nr:hypothetical protein [Planctomycetota bacterium]